MQRTGFGKSAVYFIATQLLRARGAGPTLLFSPLLALMRNQEQMAARVGLRAATLNSANREQWESIELALRDGELDVLLISPERLANPGFRDDIFAEVLAHSTGLVVIDEVHCISDWGHDFRPDYQRLGAVVDSMEPDTPVLGTTATANRRVIADVERQLGEELVTIRGPLARDGLRLVATPRWNKSRRLAWLATAIRSFPGTGIVYCLTIADTEQVAEWLLEQGILAAAYSGSDDRVAGWVADHPEIAARLGPSWDDDRRLVRPLIEAALVANEIDVVVGTSALGMGFDKPDLGFVVHYQSPGSPIAYYQQVGRAGRSLDQSVGVLLRGHEDADIQNHFIDTAFPDEADCLGVLDALDAEGPLSVARLETRVNLRRTRLQQLLKQLEVDGALRSVRGGWERTSTPWAYDHDRVAAVTALRRREQAEMEAYAETGRCLMRHLRALLDDEVSDDCGQCSVCAPSEPVAVEPTAADISAATRFLRRRSWPVAPRRQWPPGLEEVSGRIKPVQQAATGRALCLIGDGGWWPSIDRLLRSDTPGDSGPVLSDEVGHAFAELIERWTPDTSPAWVSWVPSARHESLNRTLAAIVGEVLGLPTVAVLDRAVARPPQTAFENSAQKCRNVVDAFEIVDEPPPGSMLLVDDLIDSGWTMTVVAAQLRSAGVAEVTPLALAVANGG